MTNDELMTMADLWDAGTSVAQIAREMGYSRHTIAYVAYHDRELFPRRHKSFTQGERDRWADRVLSGELGTFEAARMAGVTPQTIWRWKSRRRAAS